MRFGPAARSLFAFGAGALAFAITTFTSAYAADIVRPVVVPPPAPPPAATGLLGLFIGTGNWSDNMRADSGHFKVWGGEARANAFLAPRMSVQGDLEAEATDTGFGPGFIIDDHRILGAAGGHLSMRNQTHLVGVFGGAVGSSEVYHSDYGPTTNWFLGGEAQAYLSHVTLYAQAGYARPFDLVNDYGSQFWFARGVVRVFVTPNDKIEGEFGYATGNFTGQGCGATCQRVRTTEWDVLYEHKFMAPLSAFVEYAAMTTLNVDDTILNPKGTESQIMGGIKIYMGQPTLLANDRAGATLDLPKIGRQLFWNGWNSQ